MRTLFILFFLFMAGQGIAQPAMKFEKKNIKLEKATEGKVLEFDYPFTNTGTAPLLISDIKVACTCTKFTFPKEPVLPGKSGVIKVTFDTAGKIGYQDRTLEISSNVDGKPEVVRFRVMVENH